MLARTIMFHIAPKVMGDEESAKEWAANLAGDLSKRIPNVYVMGLAGISFPLSRISTVLGKDLEGYSPKALMADRFVYFNGQLSELP